MIIQFQVLRDLLRLHVDGEIVGEKPLTCSFNKELHAEALKRICLACPDENEDIFHGYVHGLDVLLPTSAVKNHYVKVCFVHCFLIIYFCTRKFSVSDDCTPSWQDPPVQLSIDHSSASEIEEDSDGVWSIVGGKVKLF